MIMSINTQLFTYVFGFFLRVVAPSLPGFGFSDPSARPGLGGIQIGAVMRQLMERLGHPQFYLQGGDWGAIIASLMATFYPNT